MRFPFLQIPLRARLALLLPLLALTACTKGDEQAPVPATPLTVNNTTWSASVTVYGKTTDQNVFEFSGNGAGFSWHPAGAPSYRGTWTQAATTVTFTFKETTAAGDYYWDNTGTLSSDGVTFTGILQRRGAQPAGTFSARKL